MRDNEMKNINLIMHVITNRYKLNILIKTISLQLGPCRYNAIALCFGELDLHKIK